MPYYWNIAPNRDATLYPELMSKRGVDLGGEFRYLEHDYSGEVRADFMPSDSCATATAGAMRRSTRQPSTPALPASARWACNLNLNRVSDDNYWRDFPRTPSLTQRLLANDGIAVLGQRRLQRPPRARSSSRRCRTSDSPIVPPYDRLPQLTARYTQVTTGRRLRLFASTPTTRASAPTRTLHRRSPTPSAAFALAQISRPVAGAGLVRHAQAAAERHQLPVRRAAGQRRHARAIARRARPSAWTAAWSSSATPASSAALSARRWSRAPSTSTRRSATRACCRTTTRRRTTSTSPPSTPRTRSAATTASRTTTC